MNKFGEIISRLTMIMSIIGVGTSMILRDIILIIAFGFYLLASVVYVVCDKQPVVNVTIQNSGVGKDEVVKEIMEELQKQKPVYEVR